MDKSSFICRIGRFEKICIPKLRGHLQSVKYFRFFGKDLSIMRFQSRDRSQMKGLVILFTFYMGIHVFLNSIFKIFYEMETTA